MSEIAAVLEALGRGDGKAAENLLPLVYEDLRHLAASKMARECAGHTLQPTALVHEAWLRLLREGNQQDWKDRAYFFNAAAEAMRRILIDHARRKSCLKHGGDQVRMNFDEFEISSVAPDEKILLIDEALEELEEDHPERANVVLLKFFGGMTNKEAAEAMGISERTVNRHWICAKTWLFKKILARS